MRRKLHYYAFGCKVFNASKIQVTTSPNMQNVLHACFSMYTKYRDEVPTNLCIFVLYFQTYVVDVQTAHAL